MGSPMCSSPFQVASGLDSMVLGETEIFGQLKRAYEFARIAKTTGKLLNRLFQRSFQVGKQVRSSTAITRGSVSVCSVAVDLAEQIFGELKGSKIMILGAGQTGEKTAKAFRSRGGQQILVSNVTSIRLFRTWMAFICTTWIRCGAWLIGKMPSAYRISCSRLSAVDRTDSPIEVSLDDYRNTGGVIKTAPRQRI